MWGQSCYRFWQSSNPNDFVWAVEAYTWTPPQNYYIFAYAEGADRCGTLPFHHEMSKGTSLPNASYVDGGAIDGPYLDCGQGAGGHTYRVTGSHQRRATSTSPYEGTVGQYFISG